MFIDFPFIILDLPSLSVILSSEWDNFSEPRHVTLESTFAFILVLDIDIPNLQKVNLSGPFQKVLSKSVKRTHLCPMIHI